jgi:hypothetical protein
VSHAGVEFLWALLVFSRLIQRIPRVVSAIRSASETFNQGL